MASSTSQTEAAARILWVWRDLPLFCGALAADAAGGTSFRMLGLVPLGRSPQPDSVSTKSRDDPNLREGIADPFLRALRTSPIYKSMAWVFPPLIPLL
jgi:hypothetical protein